MYANKRYLRRSVAKALAAFHVDRREWPALAADRAAWRSTLLNGAPPGFEESPPTPPIAQTRPRRVAAVAANRAIDGMPLEERDAAVRQRLATFGI